MTNIIIRLFLFASVCLAPVSYAKSIMVLGDSISAGYGIDVDEGWVSLWQKQLGDDYYIINASISGETTGGALARLQDLMDAHKPDYLLIELGGNDGLRGHPAKLIAGNLEAMINAARKSNSIPLLMQIRIPPNYGRRYTEQFERVYVALSERTNTPLMPFLIEPLAEDIPRFIQEDGIHPTAVAQPIMMQVVHEAFQGIVASED